MEPINSTIVKSYDYIYCITTAKSSGFDYGANGMSKLTPINIDVSQAYQLISIININSIERYVF